MFHSNTGSYSLPESTVRTDISAEADFEQMYNEYFPKIYNYVFYQILSKEDAEDIVSTVFMKVARSIDQYDKNKASFSTWIYRIAKNTLIDFYRTRKVEYSLDDTLEACETMPKSLQVDFEAELEHISSPKRKAIYAELAKLDERERLIIFYKYFEGYNNREIAKALDMNESTVGTVLFRTLAKLRVNALKDV